MARKHKDDGGGVQPWSKGEIFPWHVVIRANLKTGVMYVQCPGKADGPEHPFVCGDKASFYAAHRAATADAVADLEAEDETCPLLGLPSHRVRERVRHLGRLS